MKRYSIGQLFTPWGNSQECPIQRKPINKAKDVCHSIKERSMPGRKINVRDRGWSWRWRWWWRRRSRWWSRIFLRTGGMPDFRTLWGQRSTSRKSRPRDTSCNWYLLWAPTSYKVLKSYDCLLQTMIFVLQIMRRALYSGHYFCWSLPKYRQISILLTTKLRFIVIGTPFTSCRMYAVVGSAAVKIIPLPWDYHLYISPSYQNLTAGA